jgi:hypothetical protein
LEAIATANGYGTSVVGSAVYTINTSGITTPAYVQQCSNYAAGSGSGASAACTLTGVKAGDTLVIGIWTTDAALSSVTSSTTAQPISEIASYYVDSNDSNGYMSAYILPNVTAGSITVTANETGYYNSDWVSVVEFTNVSASPFDGSGTGYIHNYGAANVNSSNITTTSASDMLWSLCSDLTGITFTVGTAPITWAQLLTYNTGASLYEEYGTAGLAGTYYGQCYKSSSGYSTDIISVALKGAITPAAATPAFAPAAGTYSTIQTVSISDATASSTIYYTTNGNTPTTTSTQYTGAITVASAATIQAIATASGYETSAAGTAAYTINLSPAATPGFSPAAGSYYGSQSVTISDATANSTIYYTTNGATPTTGSTAYSSAITVSATETIEAIAVVSGAPSSTTATALYSIQTPAALTTPAPDTSTPLSGTSVTFTWVPGNTATHFEFWVGTAGPGSTDLYDSGNVTSTGVTVNDLPSNGETVYVRLYWLIGLTWHEADYTYASFGVPTQGALTTPTPNTSTPLTGTSVSFSWTPSNIVTHYEFYVGTSIGSSNLYNSGNVTATHETVGGLPSNGETVFARLYTLMDGAWKYTDYTYKATGSPTAATLTTPAPDTSTPLTGTSVTFTWNPGNLATHFEFWAGSTGIGSSNLFNSGNVTATSEIVSDLPSNGQTVYVRLYCLINGAWQEADYTYKAYGSPTAAVLTTPAPNTATPLSGTNVTFAWTPGNTATRFDFYLGTSAGSSNLYNSGNVTATSETVSNLPSNGETIYARLYWLVDGAWQYANYTYKAF